MIQGVRLDALCCPSVSNFELIVRKRDEDAVRMGFPPRVWAFAVATMVVCMHMGRSRTLPG